MAKTGLVDLWMDDTGEPQVGVNGDLLIARDADVVAQEITFRLKTTRGDWVLEPECGADLESLIGEPNSPQTGATMEALVTHALTHDSFLVGELKNCRAVPINRETIAGLITVEYGEISFTKTVTLDLREGQVG